MTAARPLIAIAAGAVLLLGGCGLDGGTATPGPATTAVSSQFNAADDPSAAPGAGQAAAQIQQNRTAAKGGTPSLLGPGLIVGAVLVFLGVGLLLRLRIRNRGLKNQRNLTPTSFYPAPYN